MSIQERLKLIRQDKNLTVEQLAEKLEMSARTITSYERAEHPPSANFLILLHKTFNVNINWLLTGQGCMYLATLEENSLNDLLSNNYNLSNRDVELLKTIIKFLDSN